MTDPDVTLVDVIDRLIGRGVVIRAELWLTIAGVELVFIGADVLIASADTMRADRMRADRIGDARAPLAADAA